MKPTKRQSVHGVSVARWRKSPRKNTAKHLRNCLPNNSGSRADWRVSSCRNILAVPTRSNTSPTRDDISQIPPDLVVKIQAIDIVEVILWSFRRSDVVQTPRRTGAHGASCIHQLRPIGPPLNSLECDNFFKATGKRYGP